VRDFARLLDIIINVDSEKDCLKEDFREEKHALYIKT
jgi:hypothetical protein